MLRELLELTKPRQTALLLLTALCAYLAAGGRDLVGLLILAASEFLAISGVTSMNMYLERDIDALMPRTASRPLPSGSLDRRIGLYFATSTYLLGLALASEWSRYLAFTILVAFLSDIILYTDIAKRSTPYSVLLGGIAGGMPALGGWSLASGLSAGGILLAAAVVAWIPMHIWFIASYYLDDYRVAGVPMLPVRAGPASAARAAEVSIAILPALTWLFFLLTRRGLLAAASATALAAVAIRGAERFRRSPSREAARSLFKFASPLIAVIFILLAAESLLGVP